MNEIFKVPQKTGDRGRPKGVEIRGGNQQKMAEVEILGATTAREPTILDRTTKKEEVEEKP